MTPEDRRAIDGLFQRLAAVGQRSQEPRDPEAEALIERRLAAEPGSAYYLAQTVIVQQQALEQAERRMEELEQGGARQVQRAGWGQRGRLEDERQNAGPWNRGAGAGMGGGFLAGAAQTAMGVAGGMLLGSMIGGLFGAGAANAAEAPADSNAGDSGQDNGGSDAGSGGDAGDAGGFDAGGGDFDMGGDF